MIQKHYNNNINNMILKKFRLPQKQLMIMIPFFNIQRMKIPQYLNRHSSCLVNNLLLKILK